MSSIELVSRKFLRFSIFVVIAAGNVLCLAVVLYGHEKAACVCVPAWIQAVLKGKYQQMLPLTIENDVSHHVVPCSGNVNIIEVHYLYNDRLDDINIFHPNFLRHSKSNCFLRNMATDVLHGFRTEYVHLV